jgi:hypothetical protein
MGTIIGSKLNNGNVFYKVLLTQEEALALKNSIKNVHIFAADLCNKEAKIIQRGKKGVTKYFTIPLSLRSRKKKFYRKISYQKLETKSKVFYIYVVDKKKIL